MDSARSNNVAMQTAVAAAPIRETLHASSSFCVPRTTVHREVSAESLKRSGSMRPVEAVKGTYWEGRSDAPADHIHMRYAYENRDQGVGYRFFKDGWSGEYQKWEYLRGGLNDAGAHRGGTTWAPADDTSQGLHHTRFHQGFMRRQASEPFAKRHEREAEREQKGQQHEGVRRAHLSTLRGHTDIFDPSAPHAQPCLSSAAQRQPAENFAARRNNMAAIFGAQQTLGATSDKSRFALKGSEGLSVKKAGGVSENFKAMAGYTLPIAHRRDHGYGPCY